jgi:hypothetical protein
MWLLYASSAFIYEYYFSILLHSSITRSLVSVSTQNRSQSLLYFKNANKSHSLQHVSVLQGHLQAIVHQYK